jgi:SAM-dependent methyltransferase
MAEGADRIVDIGAGSGHFTRLAAARFDRKALGIERDPARVEAAERAAGSSGAHFVTMDAVRTSLRLEPRDLAVGLHACGELGDRLVGAAAEAGCDVTLVSCCPQKIGTDVRRPVSRTGAALVLRRDVLGLANLTQQPVGIEAPLEAMLAAREVRLALYRLLRERGIEVTLGEAMRGINRRRARTGLRSVATAALALRGLPPPTEGEIRHHESETRRHNAAVRRLSLPRNMLARLLEVAIVLDRGAALEESGHEVLVATIFTPDISPRNLAIFATRCRDRLPRVA